MKNPFKQEVVVQEVHKYHTVEVPAGSKLPELTSDLRASLQALQHAPAFVYILQRLRFQKAAMETSLREGIQLNETQLRFLQAGVFWASQIEKDIALLTQVSSHTPRTSEPSEVEEFARVQQSLELVGA